jgi:hypothetical protein
METVTSPEEAKDFFLENSSGSVLCKKDGRELECASFPEAFAFFSAEKKEVTGASMIAYERMRQVTLHKFDEEHDDKYDRSQLSHAAQCYI